MDMLPFARVSGHHIVAWLVIGLIAGLLASVVVRGGELGFFRDITVGLIGAVIGGLILPERDRRRLRRRRHPSVHHQGRYPRPIQDPPVEPQGSVPLSRPAASQGPLLVGVVVPMLAAHIERLVSDRLTSRLVDGLVRVCDVLFDASLRFNFTVTGHPA